MSGAHAAMAFWMPTPTMLASALSVVSVHSGTMLPGTLSAPGLSVQACSPRRRMLACSCRSGRRISSSQAGEPADIFVPCLEGSPSALDLAVTGPQRIGSLSQASVEAVSAAAAYAAVKTSHLNTAATCAVQGIKFIPMVAETTGAWDKGADRILRLFASAAAAREGADGAALTGLMFQELSVCIWLPGSCGPAPPC